MASQTDNGPSPENLLVLLEHTRDVYGYLPDHALTALADQIGLPVVDIYATATFYKGLPMRPLGKHIIRVCKSVPCYLKNNRPVIEAIERELGIGPGRTTPDGLFTLQMVNCIGACDKAPAMIMDDEVLGDLTPERVKEILRSYR